MTADIHAAARREALAHRVHQDMEPGEYWGIVEGFADGAVWGADRVTPTREQLVDTLDTVAEPWDGIDLYKGADAILALMTELAEGEN